MNLPPFLLKKHLILDVETFGLSGDVFAFGAVLGRLVLSEDGEHVYWRELLSLAATDGRWALPWGFDAPEPQQESADPRGTIYSYATGFSGKEPGRDEPTRARSTFDWLLHNIPLEVFAPGRLTGDLTIHELFDAFARPHLLDGSTELWAECPVPCEATFLREMRENVGEPWGTVKIPPMRDVASLADALRIDDERADANKPAHDPLNDARHSAQRLVSAAAKLLRLRGDGA